MRIMIVDDSSVFREATKVLLSKYGIYEIVAEAENGEIAINLYQQYAPELILMDIEMPVMNGIEAAHAIKALNYQVKIIAVSAHGEKLYLNKTLNTNFSGIVYKNNMAEQLHEAITFAYVGKIYIPKS